MFSVAFWFARLDIVQPKPKTLADCLGNFGTLLLSD
jgi:hypothetical protein